MRVRDWYFHGWERKEDGKGKLDLVYRGEYYALPQGVKPPVVGLTAALLVLYAVTAMLPSPGGMWHYAAIPQLLEIIPLFYLIVGVICLVRVKGPMTFRDWYGAWRRVHRAALWSLGFTFLMAAVEIAYLIVYRRSVSPKAELTYLLREIGCIALSAVLFFFIHKHPCDQTIQGQRKEE